MSFHYRVHYTYYNLKEMVFTNERTDFHQQEFVDYICSQNIPLQEVVLTYDEKEETFSVIFGWNIIQSILNSKMIKTKKKVISAIEFENINGDFNEEFFKQYAKLQKENYE